jgi:hypothetical protein
MIMDSNEGIVSTCFDLYFSIYYLNTVTSFSCDFTYSFCKSSIGVCFY